MGVERASYILIRRLTAFLHVQIYTENTCYY